MGIDTLITARELLRDLTPLKTNCGRICGGACCEPDPEEEGENGMLLFPHEAELYKNEIEGFPFHLADDNTLYEGGKRLICEGNGNIRAFSSAVRPKYSASFSSFSIEGALRLSFSMSLI